MTKFRQVEQKRRNNKLMCDGMGRGPLLFRNIIRGQNESQVMWILRGNGRKQKGGRLKKDKDKRGRI